MLPRADPRRSTDRLRSARPFRWVYHRLALQVNAETWNKSTTKVLYSDHSRRDPERARLPPPTVGGNQYPPPGTLPCHERDRL